MKHRPYFSKTASLLETTDWSATPLGARERWPISLRNFVLMVMASPTPTIIFWGPALTQIYNDGYAEIMGPRHPRYFGAPYRECWPDTYPLIYPWMRRVLDFAEVVEVEREKIPLTRLGFDEDAYFTFTFSPLRDDEGRIAGILQPVFEVTDSVLAERRADISRALSALPAGPALWSTAIDILARASDDIADAVICEVDQAGDATTLAATPGSALATQRLETFGQLVPATPDAVQSPRADRPHTFVLPLGCGGPGSSRTWLVLETNPRLRANGAYARFVEMVGAELSSAWKRAEAATAEARQRAYLDRLFMQAPAGIAVLRGPQHVHELMNPIYRALIGHRDLIGVPVSEAVPKLLGQPFVAILDKVYRTGTPHVGLAEPVLLARAPGGTMEQVFFNYVYQPLHDGDRNPEGILIFCYEVTEQVLARQQSEQLAQALRVEHQRKDEFLAMLAHELRNPLAPVKSAADLLLRAPRSADVVDQASRIIARQVEHLSGLINDLLDVSRVTRGLVTLQQRSEDLRSVLRDAAEQARPLLESRSHRLVLDLGPAPMFVRGDHKRLVQIFANLLNNAAKYTPDRGRITLGLAAANGDAVVTIADTGIGIEAELLSRVFDLFVQGERGADRAAGGLGIGLALARSLVEMHGGRIEAESAGTGAGSTFRVRLPAIGASAEDGAAAGAADALMRGRGEPVLVVDDNVDAAHMLALQLEAAGYTVDVTHTGHGALQACAGRQYLACVVDVGLPDLPGPQVAARLKAGDGPRPLLIAVSGYGQDADIDAALDAGFDQYFVKPVDIVPLVRVLHERVGLTPNA